jgi:uncharacterized RDD family membrane protein YckC
VPLSRARTFASISAAKAGWQRLPAFLVDQVVFGVPFGVIGQTVIGGPSPFVHVLGFAVATAYFTFFWSHLGGGRTVGMRVMRLEVIATDGGELSIARALIRSLMMPFAVLPLGAGIIWAMFSRDRQTWCDLVARSYVIKL